MEQESDTKVYLKCFEDGRKLRVRIVSPGFNQDANCQFPRDLRSPGRVFSVNAGQISIAARGTQKFFYRVAKPIRVEDIGFDIPTQEAVVQKPERVFEDSDQNDCLVCLDEPKGIILVPCGHYMLCATCAAAVGKCPLCRAAIAQRITPAQME
jgi:hypothetical protein